jgi:predicted transcriptional regulator
MRRTTVKLPDELDTLLRHEAARRGMTVSELTREAITQYLEVQPRRHLLSAAAGRSKEGDIAARIEEILQEEWGRR